MTIDLQSFILGMGLVLVIALVIVSIVAMVKVMRLEKNGNNLSLGFQQQIDELHKDVEVKVGNLYKDIDSRFDKFYNKVKSSSPEEREEWKNRVLEIMRKEGVKNLTTIKNEE